MPSARLLQQLHGCHSSYTAATANWIPKAQLRCETECEITACELGAMDSNRNLESRFDREKHFLRTVSLVDQLRKRVQTKAGEEGKSLSEAFYVQNVRLLPHGVIT